MRIAQIGLGRIGFLLENDPLRYKPCTHLGTLLFLKERDQSIKIVGLCDTDNDRIQIVKKKLNKIKNITFTQNYSTILNQNPDFLIIASTTHSHFNILKDALTMGIRKILVEKPLVTNKSELKQISRLYQKYSSHIWVNYERRYYNKYICLKKILQNQYNKIISYRGLIICPAEYFYLHQKDEGLLLHDTTHLLDLIIFFFGRPQSFKSQKKRNGVSHCILLKHSNLSLEGEIVSIRHPKLFHFELEILTEQTRITVSNGYTKIEKIQASESYSNFYSLDTALAKIKKDTKPFLKTNPFIHLYQIILSKESKEDNFQDSCENIKILLNS